MSGAAAGMSGTAVLSGLTAGASALSYSTLALEGLTGAGRVEAGRCVGNSACSGGSAGRSDWS